jgi:hypothetical protein
MEKLFWLLDETSQVHFVIAAEVTGAKPVSAWQAALRAVQARHPLLNVFIHPSGFVHPSFRVAKSSEIPLRVVEAGPDYRWEGELETELATPFNASQTPLVRTVLVQQGQKSVFILASHHSIGDGYSGLLFLRDVLTALSGQSLLPVETPDSSDTLLGFTSAGGEKAAASPGPAPEQPLFTRRAEDRPVVQRRQFSPEFTQRLVNRSKAEGTTVHGALCAAFVLAGRLIDSSWQHKPVRLVSPASIRQALGKDEALAQYITSRTIVYSPQPALSFWELARFGKGELVGVISPENIASAVKKTRQFVFGNQDAKEIADQLQQGVAREIMVSNLGRFPHQTAFGELQLDGVWGPLALSGYPGDQTIGVTTTNGSLRLVHASRIPLPALLETAEAILVRACDRTAT